MGDHRPSRPQPCRALTHKIWGRSPEDRCLRASRRELWHGRRALRALLAHGDFYKAAAADCGCHDNRMDKIWWNELWMGWPVGPHYEEQSNVTQAHRLRGRLLLIVGEKDRNVDPASTMQVVHALMPEQSKCSDKQGGAGGAIGIEIANNQHTLVPGDGVGQARGGA